MGKYSFQRQFIRLVGVLKPLVIIVVCGFCIAIAWLTGFLNPNRYFPKPNLPEQSQEGTGVKNAMWVAPDLRSIPDDDSGRLIRYGRELIVHTSQYLGPNGSVSKSSNGMSCQNCHLDAGTKAFGNNYGAVASTYPKFRDRSGSIETIEKRVNDCFERSLNGKSLPSESREMRAIVAYIKWLGKKVAKGETPNGAGLVKVTFLDRAADSAKGKSLYQAKCTVCHGKKGEGILNAEKTMWTYPPLWGDDSYNDGAGMYRLISLASYVKGNMPLGATYDMPHLTDEEAWDIAAFVNSMPRPSKDISHDWPDISRKAIDHPFGPYTDGFTDRQHKYGPYYPIIDKRKEQK